jgi:hypothetical protein
MANTLSSSGTPPCTESTIWPLTVVAHFLVDKLALAPDTLASTPSIVDSYPQAQDSTTEIGETDCDNNNCAPIALQDTPVGSQPFRCLDV